MVGRTTHHGRSGLTVLCQLYHEQPAVKSKLLRVAHSGWICIRFGLHRGVIHQYAGNAGLQSNIATFAEDIMNIRLKGWQIFNKTSEGLPWSHHGRGQWLTAYSRAVVIYSWASAEGGPMAKPHGI